MNLNDLYEELNYLRSARFNPGSKEGQIKDRIEEVKKQISSLEDRKEDCKKPF